MKIILRFLVIVCAPCAIRCFPVAVIAPLVLTSCQTQRAPGPYAGNAALYTTDSAITAAFGVLDAFMVFQSVNRANLPSEVNAFADRTRRDAPGWSRSILALRDAYAASPTPANKDALDKVIGLVRVAVTQATLYLVPPTTKP
jgi:hypothetical protein